MISLLISLLLKLPYSNRLNKVLIYILEKLYLKIPSDKFSSIALDCLLWKAGKGINNYKYVMKCYIEGSRSWLFPKDFE